MPNITNNLPVTLVAQLDDVTAFQTAAFSSDDSEAASEVDNQANYSALNVGLHVNDNAKTVLNNRMRLLTAINEQLAAGQRAPINSLHWLNQVHGQQVYDVDATALPIRPLDADAMVSQQADLGLVIM